MVFFEKDLEHIYLQSIPIVVAYNEVNHYTPTKLVSLKEFQSWKVQQCIQFAQGFVNSAAVVNKDFVSDEVSSRLESSVDSLNNLLSLYAMQGAQFASGEPVGPILHVPDPPGQEPFLSGVPVTKKGKDKSTMTMATTPHPPPPPPPPTPTPTSSKPPTISKKKSLDCEVCKQHFTRSNDLRDHKISAHKMGNPFICLICAKTYTKQRNLNQHIKNKHQNTYRYTCSKQQKSGKQCKLQTDSKDVFITHNVKYHDVEPEMEFRCPKCQKNLMAKAYYQNI